METNKCAARLIERITISERGHSERKNTNVFEATKSLKESYSLQDKNTASLLGRKETILLSLLSFIKVRIEQRLTIFCSYHPNNILSATLLTLLQIVRLYINPLSPRKWLWSFRERRASRRRRLSLSNFSLDKTFLPE